MIWCYGILLCCISAYLIFLRVRYKNQYHTITEFQQMIGKRIMNRTNQLSKQIPFLNRPDKNGYWERELELLNPFRNGQTQVIEIKRRMTGILVLVFLGGCIFCFSYALSRKLEGEIKEDRYIERNEYDTADKNIPLSLSVGETEQPFDLVIESQKYAESELEQFLEQAEIKLPDLIRGENTSLDNVTANLNLVTEIENLPFSIYWESSRYELVDDAGCVSIDQLKAPELVDLTARLQYEDFVYEICYPIRICPKKLTSDEALLKELKEELETLEKETRTTDRFIFPEKIDGKIIKVEERKVDDSYLMGLLLLVVMSVIYWGQWNEIKKKIARRNRELEDEYPVLISKLVMYLTAGMTLRNAWMRIGEQYQEQKKKSNTTRFLYEEILLCCRAFAMGISEAEIYAQFGKRCRLRQYTRLSALLSQNLKKGNSNLLEMMKQEARESFEEKKQNAQKAGAVAETKLLFPMMILLCIVLVIIMIPAYLSFMN